jgi:hypothetical protein
MNLPHLLLCSKAKYASAHFLLVKISIVSPLLTIYGFPTMGAPQNLHLYVTTPLTLSLGSQGLSIAMLSTMKISTDVAPSSSYPQQ